MKNLILAALVPVMCQGGCASDEAPPDEAPPTAVAQSPLLDGSGNWYGLRPFGDPMVQTAADIGFSPFAVNALPTPDVLAKITGGYEQIGGILGETSVGTNQVHVAKFAARVFTRPADGITAITSAGLKAVLVGNANGSAATHAPPTGCSTTLAGVTEQMYIPDAIDAATELLRSKFSASDQGIYTWCRGTVIVFRDSLGLHGQKLDAFNNIVSVTLTPTCAATDAADVCVGKQATVANHAAAASLLAANASNSRPTVDSTSDSDANIRSGSYPFVLNLTLVQDNAQSQMNSFWSRIFDGSTGSATFENKIVGRGATACDPLVPLNCP